MQIIVSLALTDTNLILAIFLAAAVLALLLVLAYQNKIYTRKLKEEAEKNKAALRAEQKRLAKIFAGAGLGLAVYKPNGSLQTADKTIRSLLKLEVFPPDILTLLDNFGQSNGLKASYLLGNTEAEADLKINDRVIRLKYKRVDLSESDNPSKENYQNSTESKSEQPDGKGSLHQPDEAEQVSAVDREADIIVFARDISREIEEDEQRKKFVANVSHELKTPITVMKIYAETLLDWGLAEKKPQAIRSDIKQILASANRMEMLVEDLLLLSKIDSRGKSLQVEEADLQNLLSEVVKQLEVQAQEKNISLNYHVLSKIPPVLADKNSISRVFANLITNAIKYTGENGVVDVYISRVINDIVIKVKDNGPGISEKDQEHIFERFFRVDQTGSRQYGGTGLGLSIAKELVEVHSGKISVHSILSYGSEFIVTLPLAAKVYVQVMEDISANKPEDKYGEYSSPIAKYAYQKLLLRADALGYPVKFLEDLTSQERSSLLEPYIKEVRSVKSVKPNVDEDFAGVLGHSESSPDSDRAVEADTDETDNLQANFVTNETGEKNKSGIILYADKDSGKDSGVASSKAKDNAKNNATVKYPDDHDKEADSPVEAEGENRNLADKSANQTASFSNISAKIKLTETEKKTEEKTEKLKEIFDADEKNNSL